MSNTVVFDTLNCRDQKKIATITLNNPKALNALSLDMVKALTQQLNTWRNKKDIVMIVIKGEGDRAFCAGGDVKSVYRAIQEKGESKNLAEAFFKHEYRLDYMLHQYPKPILAWGNGIVMGGGLGIFMGAKFRVATESSVFAMPEITIGLYPDVGAGVFLNQAPGYSGRMLGLTGAQANAKDSLYLKFASQFICKKFYSEVISMLREQSWFEKSADNAEIIGEILDNFAADSVDNLPQGNVERLQGIITEIFSVKNTKKTFELFLALKTQDPWLTRAQQTFREGSPLSAAIIDRHLKESKSKCLKDVFKSEMILSANIIRHQEFAEGVRALLIDKDNKPQWTYKSYQDLPSELVDSFFKAPWEKNPLANL